MSESGNLQTLQNAYRVWHDSKGKSAHAWLEIMADEIYLHSVAEQGAGLDFARDCHSKQEAVRYLTALVNDWEMRHWTPDTFVANGNRIAMFGRCAWTFKATGKEVEVDIAHLWRFENGKAVELLEVFDSAVVVAAASPQA